MPVNYRKIIKRKEKREDKLKLYKKITLKALMKKKIEIKNSFFTKKNRIRKVLGQIDNYNKTKARLYDSCDTGSRTNMNDRFSIGMEIQRRNI